MKVFNRNYRGIKEITYQFSSNKNPQERDDPEKLSKGGEMKGHPQPEPKVKIILNRFTNNNS